MPAKIFQDPARVTIRMERSDKKELEAEAEKQSIPLADLCRDRLKRRRSVTALVTFSLSTLARLKRKGQ